MTTTSYGIDPQPNLVPAMDGKKVVFSREVTEEPKAEEQPASESEQPKKSKGSDK